MLKQGLTLIVLCSLVSANTTDASLEQAAACTNNGFVCFMQGFAAGLTPDKDYNNICITGFQNVWTYADGTWEALLAVFSDTNNLWLAIDKATQFVELWDEQTDRCKVPSIILGFQGLLSFENLGQLGLKWIINSQEYNQYVEALQNGWESTPRNWQIIGESIGSIFRGWTNFEY